MIKLDDEGWLVIDFRDWTPAMMGLSFVLSKLPVHRDMPEELLHSYPVGIERLRASGGDKAVKALYRVASELEFRPSCYDVVELGKRLLLMDARFNSFVEARAHGRSVMRGREKALRRREQAQQQLAPTRIVRGTKAD